MVVVRWSAARTPMADPSRGHEGGVYQRLAERVKRSAGRSAGPAGSPDRSLDQSFGAVLGGASVPPATNGCDALVVIGGGRLAVGGQERVGEVGLVVRAAGDGRRQRELRRPRRRAPGPPRPRGTGCTRIAEIVERLAGERLEGGPALALLARGDVGRRPGPGRDELADDDVLLEPDQVVLGAVDGGLGQHPGRLLEGRRGEEARGVERGLGDARAGRSGPWPARRPRRGPGCCAPRTRGGPPARSAAGRRRPAGRCGPCGASAGR